MKSNWGNLKWHKIERESKDNSEDEELEMVLEVVRSGEEEVDEVPQSLEGVESGKK